MEDQKKRTMEALERRFALAKAEVLQQHQKNKKRPYEERDLNKRNVSSSVSSAHATANPSPNTSFKKVGNVSNSSLSTPKDSEANDPTYFLLSHPVHENLTSTNTKIPDRRGNVVDHILHELLQNGDSAHKYTQGSRSVKVDHSILLDNLVQGNGSRPRTLQSRSKRSKRHMSMKQLKKSGLFVLPPDFHDYEKFKLMHEIWKDYIMQHLKNVGKAQLARCLLSADLHGAIILVAECKRAATFTGISGIMIRETAETFGLITLDNKFRVVPKKDSVFVFQAECWKITLHGDKLCSRNLLQ